MKNITTFFFVFYFVFVAHAQDCAAIVKEAGNIANLERRIQYINRNIDRCPTFSGLYQSRGFAYFQLKDFSSARKDMNQCIEIYKNEHDYTPASIANFLKYRGICNIEIGNYKEGLQDLSGYTKYLSETWETALYKGRGNFFLKKSDAAFSFFNKAVALKSDTSIVWYERGISYLEKGAYTVALNDFNMTIQRSPNMAIAYIQQGECYFAMGDDEQALQSYLNGEKLDSSITMHYIHKEKALENLKLKEIKLAKISFVAPAANVTAVSSPDYILKICVQVEELEELKIYLNGRILPVQRDLVVKKENCDVRIYEAIELKPGLNEIYITVKNKAGIVQSDVKKIRYDATQTTQKKAALVIGNSNYKYTTPLKNPGNDVDDISLELKKLNFDVFAYKDQTYGGMLETINQFSQLRTSYDILMVYYSGHGIQYNGLNYLVPIDASPDKPIEAETECVLLDRVLNDISNERGKSASIVVLDACRTNPWSKSWQRIIGADPSSGLAPIKAPSGSLVAFAADANQPADDCADERNGCYTGVFLRHLGTSGQTIEQTLKKVRSEVIEKTSGKQQPAEYSKLIGADVILKNE
jgi:tetratricopeptide (TPR) repeat protein